MSELTATLLAEHLKEIREAQAYLASHPRPAPPEPRPLQLALALVTPEGSISWLEEIPVPLHDALYAFQDYLNGEPGWERALPPGTQTWHLSCVPHMSWASGTDRGPGIDR